MALEIIEILTWALTFMVTRPSTTLTFSMCILCLSDTHFFQASKKISTQLSVRNIKVNDFNSYVFSCYRVPFNSVKWEQGESMWLSYAQLILKG